MSTMNFSKQETSPDSSQPAACMTRFAPARNAGSIVFSASYAAWASTVWLDVAERRVDVDDRKQRGRGLDGLAAAEQDLGHPDRVARVRARRDRAEVRLVGDGLQREGHVEVTRVERPVARLADHAAGRVDLRERL